MASRSTELEIITRSLAEVMRRIEAAPQTPLVQEITGRALAYRRAVSTWESFLPSENERSTLMREVLGMHIQLMHVDLGSEEPLVNETDESSVEDD